MEITHSIIHTITINSSGGLNPEIKYVRNVIGKNGLDTVFNSEERI